MKRIGLKALPVLVVLACAGAAMAATRAGAPPPGEPAVPGIAYATPGVGAPYLSTKGAPRHLSGFGIGPLGGALQASAEKAGVKAAKALGPKITKPLGIKLGYLDIIGGIESADRDTNGTRTAFEHIGAKVIYCDGAGNPQKWTTCGQSLIAQGANVIAINGIDPSTIPAVIRAAKAKHILIVDAGGIVGPGADLMIAPDEQYSGSILAKYLQAKLKGQSGTQDILTIDYPAPWATVRTKALDALVATDSHLKIALKATSDPTNLVAGTQKQVADEITADPALKAIWVSFDTVGQVAGQVVASKFPGKKFPDKPLVVTFHADPSTQPLLKSGAIDAVVDFNYEITCWEVANAVAEKFARHTKLPGYKTSMTQPGIGNPITYQMVTGANLPPSGTYARPAVDGVSYFIAKWKAEGFGK